MCIRDSARARAGEGPSFLELKTYRYHGHFHADVPLNYRTAEEEEYYRERDPLKSFEKRVTEQKLMTAKKLKGIRDTIEKEMIDAVDFAMNSPMPDPESLYSDVYVSYSNPIPGLR